jgi:hypothetical protein
MNFTQSILELGPRLQSLSSALVSMQEATTRNEDMSSKIIDEIQLTQRMVSDMYLALTNKSVFDFQQRSDFLLSQGTCALLNQAIVQSILQNGIVGSLSEFGVMYTMQQFQYNAIKYLIMPDVQKYADDQNLALSNQNNPSVSFNLSIPSSNLTTFASLSLSDVDTHVAIEHALSNMTAHRPVTSFVMPNASVGHFANIALPLSKYMDDFQLSSNGFQV